MRVLPSDRLWRLPVIAIGEFLFGLERSKEKQKLRKWIDEVIEHCLILNVDLGTAAAYSEIREELRRAATPIPENDIWIAALCRQHGLALASRDAHFAQVSGLKRITW